MAERSEKRSRRLRRNGFVEVTNALLTLLIIGLVIAGGALLWGAQQFYDDGPTTVNTTFLVEPNNGLRTVAERLEQAGLIKSGLLFQAAGYAMGKQSAIKAGEYTIEARSSMGDILETITEGKPNEYFVNVPPGETSYMVAERINDPAQNLTGDPVPVPAEGSVLPVRHDYFPRTSRETLLKAMQDAMAAKVNEAWEACETNVCGPGMPVRTKQDLVILASIVEKETGLETERPQVASLMINRLRAGMRLQTDPTIIYGITKGQRTLEGGITASQKAQQTPYNTYLIDGLPPTPIANPGEAALMAVARPADTNYLYMMAVTPGKPSDGHYFASTLAEHQANEAKYRRLEDQLAAEEAAGDAADEAPAQ